MAAEFEYDVFMIEGDNHLRVATTMNENYGPKGWEAYSVIPVVNNTAGRSHLIVHMRKQVR